MKSPQYRIRVAVSSCPVSSPGPTTKHSKRSRNLRSPQVHKYCVSIHYSMGVFPAKAAVTRIGIRSARGKWLGCWQAGGPAALDLHLRPLFLCLPVEPGSIVRTPCPSAMTKFSSSGIPPGPPCLPSSFFFIFTFKHASTLICCILLRSCKFKVPAVIRSGGLVFCPFSRFRFSAPRF